eukprot:CAMPEP_0183298190 /NCGR_PEP_ID=MMETSP0160_2-20130417/5290_1 /TAXON_ID=2839 ORGANISM="Odontella Sinensis, Strain Grunow 1884" /NCGR_SAMPLE_ID=MMETSP0160_2 /ASSEMBLY_ACC=CAM_ASM_000250 /LENGTH=177 /DNA_ID=CAMNT_0025460171 /DNA_START=23 /DNA_END=556 /DNA_ORIENTATION=+
MANATHHTRKPRNSSPARPLLFAAAILLSARSARPFSTTPQRMPSAYIDKLALVLIRSRSQLVARTRGKSVLFTPGGKREPGESDADALRREIREELSVELRPNTIRPYGVFEAQAFGKPEGTAVRLTCYSAECEGTPVPSAEVEELKWIRSDFSRELLSVTGVMLLDDLKAKDLID